MDRVRIGIDASINSTGITILQPNQPAKYYIVTNHLTKKQSRVKSDIFKYLTYDKTEDLTSNVIQISDIISKIVGIYKGKNPIVQIEDIALGAIGSRSLVDLSILNGAIRAAVYKETGIIIRPINIGHWKKVAVGIGNATKEVIKDAWKRLDSDAYELLKEVKSDDVADSFFIANLKEEGEEEEEAADGKSNDAK